MKLTVGGAYVHVPPPWSVTELGHVDRAVHYRVWRARWPIDLVVHQLDDRLHQLLSPRRDLG